MTTTAQNMSHGDRPDRLFQYEALQDVSSSIRLVRIEAQHVALGEMPGCPRCYIHHQYLANRPKYTALSYSWGDLSDTKPILLNGRRKEVTRSLWDFLSQTARDLRDSRIAAQDFWIDAICINQDNDLGKSHQVAVMGRIYSTAASMVIWLGRASHDSHLAFDLLSLMSNILKTINHNNLLRSICQHDGKSVKALVSLLERKWWRRLWVQQEIALSKEGRTELVCGKSRLRWWRVTNAHRQIDISLFARSLALDRPEVSNRSVTSTSGKELEILTTLAWCWSRMQQTCRNTNSPASTSETLKARPTFARRLAINAVNPHHRLEASNPLDYVYSLVSICSDIEGSEWIPDYSKPKEDLYFQVAQYLLEKTGPFIFGLCSEVHCYSNSLPSWVPNLASLPLGRPISPVPKNKSAFSDYFGSESAFYREIDGLTLQLHGTRVDTVFSKSQYHLELSKLPASKSGGEEAANDWLLAYVKYLDSLPQPEEDGFPRAWWKLPICNQRPEHSRLEDRSQWSEHLKDLLEHVRKDGNDNLDTRMTDYRELMSNFALGRTPFLTDSDRIGLGPIRMRPGDELFVIAGSKVPLILRPTISNAYILIGEAYVYRLDWKEFLKHSSPLQKISIV